jgi:multiple sugar transport system permease protein
MMKTARWFLLLAVVVAIAFTIRSVFARGGKKKKDKRIELVVWGIWRQEGWNKAYAKFEEMHPEVKLILSTTGGRMDEQKLMCAIAGDAPPDVVNQDRFSVGGWAARGAFIPLDEFIERDKNDKWAIRGEDFYSACWDEAVFKGKVYAIPNTTDDRILYYNEDILRREGFVDKNGNVVPPKNWDELKRYALKMTKRDAQGRITQIGFIPNFGNSWLYLYGWQNGGEFTSKDGRTCTLNDPKIRDAAAWVTDVYDALGGAQKVEAFRSGFQGGEFDPFLTGKVAMKIDGAPGVVANIAALKPDFNFGVAPAPVPAWRLKGVPEEQLRDYPNNWLKAQPPNHLTTQPPPFITWSGGFSWVIPKGARHPELAWEFIKWMSSKDAAILMNDATARYNRSRGRLYVPALSPNKKNNEVIFERFAPTDERLRKAFKFSLDMMEVSRFRPVTPVGQLLWDEQRRALDQAIYHSLTPQQAVDFGTWKVQKQLDFINRKVVFPTLNWLYPLFSLIALIVFGVVIVRPRFHAYLRERSKGPEKTEAYAGYVFISPWLIGFIVFTAGPMLASILLSFCQYDILHPVKWVGADNYASLLRFNRAHDSIEANDPLFWRSLWNTIYMVIAVPIGMAVGLGVAMLLNANVKGMAFYRTVFYLPAIVPGVAAAFLWIWILHPEFGLLNVSLKPLYTFLKGFPLLPLFVRDKLPPAWLQEPLWAKPALILMGLWGAGAGMIIWLAGLKGIPQQLYEAAQIDGASNLRQFRSVTLPMLSPYIFFNLVMGIIGTFQIFDSAYQMTNGEFGPVDATLFYVAYLFNQAFRYFRMGYASALAWILFLLIASLTYANWKLRTRWVFTEGGEA